MFKDFLQIPLKSKKGKKTTIKKYSFEITVDRHVETNIREYILWEIKKEKPEKRKKQKTFMEDATHCNGLNIINSVKEKGKKTKSDKEKEKETKQDRRKKKKEVKKYKEKKKELKLRYMKSMIERNKCITKYMKALNEEMTKHLILPYGEKTHKNEAECEENGKENKETHEEVNEKINGKGSGEEVDEKVNGKVNEEVNGKINEKIGGKVNEEINGKVN